MLRDEELSQLYRQLPQVEPHPRLDESILAFARQNTVKPEARAWAWIWRLSLPLTAVAALSLWWVFQPQDVTAPQETPGPVAMVAPPPAQTELKTEDAPVVPEIPQILDEETPPRNRKKTPALKKESAKRRPAGSTGEALGLGGLGTKGTRSLRQAQTERNSEVLTAYPELPTAHPEPVEGASLRQAQTERRSDLPTTHTEPQTAHPEPVEGALRQRLTEQTRSGCALFYPPEFNCELISSRDGQTIVKVDAVRILVPWIRGLGFRPVSNKENEFKHMDGRRLRLEYVPEGPVLIIFYDEKR